MLDVTTHTVTWDASWLPPGDYGGTITLTDMHKGKITAAGNKITSAGSLAATKHQLYADWHRSVADSVRDAQQRLDPHQPTAPRGDAQPARGTVAAGEDLHGGQQSVALPQVQRHGDALVDRRRNQQAVAIALREAGRSRKGYSKGGTVQVSGTQHRGTF